MNYQTAPSKQVGQPAGASASANPVSGGQKVALSQQKNPTAIAIASAVRNNKELKQRQGINTANNDKQDFFRYKRFVRALKSNDYNKKSKKRPDVLPAIDDDESAQKIFVMLIQNQLVIPVRKLKTKVAKDKGVKVTKTTPALEIIHKAVLQPDSYFMWNFTPPNPYLLIYSILGLAGVFTVVLFPLWPYWMRRGVWYISTGLLVLIGLFFAIAIVRLIIYIVTWVSMPQQFWLFPNLFADCGVIESFQPFYEWEDPKQKKGGHKKANMAKTTGGVSEKATNGTAVTGSQTSATKPAKRAATVVEVEDDGN
ncbi:DEKNAAC101758 [Brettanomyces naardenensis]|uniref:Translocation protein SEC62 n=1 Tax=Brettanomyces naardenensis TaxID=13370 RepID=A0A448YJ19_BRENA|nr:DEKNAAC101758 [Brettanomyces naardenensis]